MLEPKRFYGEFVIMYVFIINKKFYTLNFKKMFIRKKVMLKNGK